MQKMQKFERIRPSSRRARTVGVGGYIRKGSLVKGYRRMAKHSITRGHLKRIA